MLKIGDLVQIREDVGQLTHGWGPVMPGDVGTVKEIWATNRVKINFKAHEHWWGLLTEIALVDTEELFATAIDE